MAKQYHQIRNFAGFANRSGIKGEGNGLYKAQNISLDKAGLIKILSGFLKLTPDKQTAYLIGRRTGIFSTLDDMEKPGRMAKVENYCYEYDITPENVDDFTEKLLNRFI